MSRLLFAWKYDQVTKKADIPIYKTGPWYWIVAYRIVMWWQSVGFDAEEWVSRRLGESS